MVAVSGGLLFAGYQLLVYGWSQVSGSNAGFFDILWPGRYKGNAPDHTAVVSGGVGPGQAGLNDAAARAKAGYPLGAAGGYPNTKAGAQAYLNSGGNPLAPAPKRGK
jgi:hypothetical protein